MRGSVAAEFAENVAYWWAHTVNELVNERMFVWCMSLVLGSVTRRLACRRLWTGICFAEGWRGDMRLRHVHMHTRWLCGVDEQGDAGEELTPESDVGR